MRAALMIAVLSAIALTGAVSADDPPAQMVDGRITFSSGFTPERLTAEVVAGGHLDGRQIAYNCPGWVSGQPQRRIRWSGGPLTIGVESDRYDTSLLIMTPDGRIFCDDDTHGVNPEVTLPGSGDFDIYVGAITTGWLTPMRVELYITEP